MQKTRSSLVKFDGQKSGWDVSIVDKEFNQSNGESMIVMWEKDQRRFLFFWNGNGSGTNLEIGFLDSGPSGSIQFSAPLHAVFALTDTSLGPLPWSA